MGSNPVRMLEEVVKLGSMPGFKIEVALEMIGASLHTLKANYADLEGFLTEVEHDPSILRAVTWGSHDARVDYLNETTRQIHNYVAAVKTLVDHTRKLERSLLPTEADAEDYEERVRVEFAESPLAQFVQQLRNYSLHVRPAEAGIRVTWRGEDRVESRIVSLRVKDLQEWDGWNRHAERYLATCGREVDLLAVCLEYRDRVVALYDEFEALVRRAHSQDLGDLRRQQHRAWLLQIEDLLERAPLSEAGTRSKREKMVFGLVLAGHDFGELEELGDDLEGRASLAIGKLESHLRLPEDTQALIREWYGKHMAPDQIATCDPTDAGGWRARVSSRLRGWLPLRVGQLAPRRPKRSRPA